MQLDKEQKIEGEETQSFDTDAALADISTELFGESGEVDKSTIGEPGSESESETPPAQPRAPDGKFAAGDKPAEGEVPKPDDTSAEVQAVGAPKTWTKEALEKWATLDPVVQKEVAKREEDFMRGINIYKQAAEVGARYDDVVTPYRQILAAEGIDPVDLFKSFSANHYILSRGDDSQKVQLAANLLTSYRIPLDKLADALGNRQIVPVNPEVEALRRELLDLRSGINQRTVAEQQFIQLQSRDEVDRFADDPSHPYFDEVGHDMSNLVAGGLASNLQDAYDKAVWANPVTRAKELERVKLQDAEAAKAEAAKRQDKNARSTAEQVRASQTNRSGTAPVVGSIDDTLEETLAAIQARG